MDYLVWAVLALVAYALVGPLVNISTKDIPPAVGLFLATIVFLSITSVVIVLTGTADSGYLADPRMWYVLFAGVLVTVGILAYVRALQIGPVSIVVPIYGMFIVGSSAVGILFLGEALTLRRIAGIGCAVIAIVLGTGEGGE